MERWGALKEFVPWIMGWKGREKPNRPRESQRERAKGGSSVSALKNKWSSDSHSDSQKWP